MSKALLDSADAISTTDLNNNWHEAPRGWGHSLHKLAPYVGSYPPALARYFITRYSNEGDVVLDPFCGGGTTPLEAGLCEREAFGNDAFQYAYILTHAKCNPLAKDEFDEYLKSVLAAMDEILESNVSLDNEEAAVFFSEKTLESILRMRNVLSNDNSRKAIYLKALICGILHGPSGSFLSVQTKDTFSGSPDYVKEYINENDLKIPNRDIEQCARTKFNRVIGDGIPSFESTITKTDARDLQFENESVDMVLTSPPYMHVLDYSWNNWLRLWWLGVDRDEERDSLDITADVERYRNFINKSLKEIYRVLKPDSRAVLVVGDAKKHRASGTKVVRTGQLIAEEAAEAGFILDHVIDDTYDTDKRSYVKFNELRYNNAEADLDDSEELLERCIVLNKGTPETDNTVNVPWA